MTWAVIDLDSHLMEPADYLSRFATAGTAAELSMAPHIPAADPQWLAPGAFDRTERRRWLDEHGIERQVVLPGLSHVAFAGTRLGVEAANAQHRASMAWADGDPRFEMVLCVPIGEPHATARMVESVAAAGARLALLVAAVGPIPSLIELEPVWSALADTKVIGVLHFGTTWNTLPNRWRVAGDRIDGEAADPIDVVCAHHAVEGVVARLALSGVFDRHPGLRLLAAEHGAAWLPGLLTSLDACQRAYRRLDPGIPQDEPLSDQVRRALTVTPFGFEPIGQLVDLIGDDVLAFATDHPHPEGGSDPAGRFQQALDGRPAEPFFSGNAAALLA